MIEESISQIEFDQELETAAVTGAVAVQRLIADRNNLRNQLASQERELTAARAAQEELRRRFGVLHQRYIELARKIVSQLHHFDSTIREAMGQRAQGPNNEAENVTGSESQFDSTGLPVGGQLTRSRPTGNGTTYDRDPPPLEA